MWDTVLDHRYGYANGLANKTYLVCKIDGVSIPIITENTTGTHAEKQLIIYLEKKKVAKNNLTVYINNSPCAVCAEELQAYLEKNKGIRLTLYVTHLYNIKRRSCQLRANDKEKEGHMDYIDGDEHEANYQGLRDLMSLGSNRCKIEGFTKGVWSELHEVMGLTEDCKQRMKKYDTTNTTHDRSRKSEDSNIILDLVHVNEYSNPWHGIVKPKKSEKG